MKDVDVVIIGAGPYGLSLAAHLRAADVTYRQFGVPMSLWQAAMPRGTFLKSQGFALNLSSPDRRHTLETFCRATDRPYKSYGQPVSLETFVAYGLWFQQQLVPDVQRTLVTEVVAKDDHFEVGLADGATCYTAQVVVAAGVEHFARLPEELGGLPAEVCSHSSAHSDLAAFAGRNVVVLGRGQSALESAALLHERGATVSLVTGKSTIAWIGQPLAPDRNFLQRLHKPKSGLGPGWELWLYSNRPALFRHLPQRMRAHRATTALGPAGANWLATRVEGQVSTLLSHTLTSARPDGAGVRLSLTGPDGPIELEADHVIAATGFRPDLARLTFLSDQLRPALSTLADTPVVDRTYQSAVPGLYFIGPVVAPSFGPVMRFVCGADHAARTVSRALAARASTSDPRPAVR